MLKRLRKYLMNHTYIEIHIYSYDRVLNNAGSIKYGQRLFYAFCSCGCSMVFPMIMSKKVNIYFLFICGWGTMIGSNNLKLNYDTIITLKRKKNYNIKESCCRRCFKKKVFRKKRVVGELG